MVSLNTIINIRGLLHAAPNKAYFTRHMWCGQCAETISALRGDDEHIVRDVAPGIVLIYRRRGYVFPHFISFDKGVSFVCPWWCVNSPTRETDYV